MDWQDVGHAVAKSAPALGAALGGPAGAAVGGLIAAAFGVDRNAAAVAEAVANDPEAAVKLREVELRHAEVLAELMTQRYLGDGGNSFWRRRGIKKARRQVTPYGQSKQKE